MNKFDVRYDIRLANMDDIPMIMKFIDEHWRKGHIMAVDRELFEYEFVHEDKVNFVLAIEKNGKTLEGIFGFLNCSYTQNDNKKDIWGSMWKVLDGNMPLLGIELAKRVIELTGCRVQIGNGANPNTTVPLRKIFFREKTAKMKHYYMLNSECTDFKIAIIREKKLGIPKHNSDKKIKRLNSIEEVKKLFDLKYNEEYIPFKDYAYIDKRYFKHPYYNYDVYGIMNNENIEALLVLREVETNNSKVLRIMDYIGKQSIFAGLNNFFVKILKENEYEYIDFYVLGFEENAISDAGFVERIENDENIIPNYFEPFLQQNVEIWTHYKDDNTTFFKADGDQDRPNKIK